MDQGILKETKEVFFAELDLALRYSDYGFSIRGRNKKEVSKMFTSIEPDIADRIEGTQKTQFLNILYHLQQPEYNTLDSNPVMIAVNNEWYIGETLSVYFGVGNEIFKTILSQE